MRRGKSIGLLLSLLFTGIAFSGCSAKLSKIEPSKARNSSANKTSSNRVGTAVGDIAPDFELAAMNGSRLKRADLNGQPAVLIFWTAWCPVCKEEAPEFNELAAQFATRGVRVIGINIQDSVARTEAGIKEFGIQYTVARDPDAAVTRRYKVTGTPTIVLIDRNGVVRYFGNELPLDYASRLVSMLEQKS
jgi:peroxiredoxin